MPKQFILSSSNNIKEFNCLSLQTSITIVNATLLNSLDNYTLLDDNAYLEITFTFTNEDNPSKLYGLTRPLNLRLNKAQQQTTIHFNKLINNSTITNTNIYYQKLSIKLVERKNTLPQAWSIIYEPYFLEECNN
jgi:hypothetical protein